MCSVIFLQVLQIVVRPLVSWLYAGGEARAGTFVAAAREPAIVEPCRDLLQWPRGSGATSDPAGWAFPTTQLVAFACYRTVVAIARVARDGLLAPAFLADVVDGALEFAVTSFKLGSPLGVVSAGAVRAKERQRIAAELGYSEMVFIEDPSLVSGSGRAEIFSSVLEAAARRSLRRRRGLVAAPAWDTGRSLQFRAGAVEVNYAGDPTTAEVFAEWTPEFVLHQLNSSQDVVDAGPGRLLGYLAALGAG